MGRELWSLWSLLMQTSQSFQLVKATFLKWCHCHFFFFDALVLLEFSKPEPSLPKLYFRKVTLPRRKNLEWGSLGSPVIWFSVPSSSAWHSATCYGEPSLWVQPRSKSLKQNNTGDWLIGTRVLLACEWLLHGWNGYLVAGCFLSLGLLLPRFLTTFLGMGVSWVFPISMDHSMIIIIIFILLESLGFALLWHPDLFSSSYSS